LAKQSASQGQPLDAILWPETVFNGLALDVDSLKAEQAAGLAYRWTPGTAGIEGINGQLPSTFFADTMLTQQAASGVPWLVGTIAYNNLSLTLSPEGRVKEAHNGKFNSVAMMDQGRVSPKRYDKVELMAFGEYIPIAWRWPSLQRSITVLGAGGMEFDLAQGTQDTSFRFNTADDKAISFVTPICFEACSHSACVSLLYDMDWLGAKSRRAHLMFNPTNDGWFYDHDLGRRLHLLAARWRCMELAAPMVRVANTGISCWIDMRGVVHDVIPARQFGTKVITVPSTDWTPPPSLYARLGHHVRWLMLSLLVLQVVFLFTQTRPKNPPASASPT
jgi:apolipoprotein N-acyltransferase